VSDTQPSQSEKKTWLAALLTLLVPGLGHLYIRMWGGAVLWFLLYFTATVVLFPTQSTPSDLSLDGLVAWGEAMPIEVALTVMGITALCMADVYVRTRQLNQRPIQRSGSGSDVQRCPDCGKELDADLDFCHWCTTELPKADSNDRTDES
jgi:hypothetical protein